MYNNRKKTPKGLIALFIVTAIFLALTVTFLITSSLNFKGAFEYRFQILPLIFSFEFGQLIDWPGYIFSSLLYVFLANAVVSFVLGLIFSIVKRRLVLIPAILLVLASFFMYMVGAAGYQEYYAAFQYGFTAAEYLWYAISEILFLLFGVTFIILSIIAFYRALKVVTARAYVAPSQGNSPYQQQPQYNQANPYQQPGPQPYPTIAPQPAFKPLPQSSGQEQKSNDKEDIKSMLREVVRDIVRDEIARNNANQPKGGFDPLGGGAITGATFGGPLVVQYFNGGINSPAQPAAAPAEQEPNPEPAPQSEEEQEPEVEEPPVVEEQPQEELASVEEEPQPQEEASPQPEPEPQPAPEPEPVPESEPQPEPEPAPIAEPAPAPIVEPVPEPQPAPQYQRHFCSQCGQEVNPNSTFCPCCGNRLKELQPAPAPQPAPVVVAPVPQQTPKKAPAPKKEEPEEKKPIIRIPFTERMINADKEMQDNYNELKNEIMSYGVNFRVSNSGDTFRLHRKTYVKITIAGLSLKLYFALNPDDYKDSTIPVQNAGHKGIYAEIPLVFKVKSPLSMRRCKELIQDVMDKNGLEQGEVKNIDWVEDLKTVPQDNEDEAE